MRVRLAVVETHLVCLLCCGQVLRALHNGQNALLESPTGTGKTLALLCSVLTWQLQYKQRGCSVRGRVKPGVAKPGPSDGPGVHASAATVTGAGAGGGAGASGALLRPASEVEAAEAGVGGECEVKQQTGGDAVADSAAVGVTVDVTVDVADTSSLPMVNVVDEAGVTSDSEMSTAVASVCDATGDGDGDRGDDQSVDGTDGSEDEDEDRGDDSDEGGFGSSSDDDFAAPIRRPATKRRQRPAVTPTAPQPPSSTPPSASGGVVQPPVKKRKGRGRVLPKWASKPSTPSGGSGSADAAGATVKTEAEAPRSAPTRDKPPTVFFASRTHSQIAQVGAPAAQKGISDISSIVAHHACT